MIATWNNLPLLEDQHGGICAIDTGWLLAAVDRAAIKAGFAEWWLADHVTTSVCSYLRNIYNKNVVNLGRLQEVVKQTLEDVGYEEIARCFSADSPACHFSLLQCAQGAGANRLDRFYELLALRIDEVHRSKLTSFHFYDLHACLSHLNHAAAPDAAVPLQDIVRFIRYKVGSLRWERPVSSSVQ